MGGKGDDVGRKNTGLDAEHVKTEESTSTATTDTTTKATTTKTTSVPPSGTKVMSEEEKKEKTGADATGESRSPLLSSSVRITNLWLL